MTIRSRIKTEWQHNGNKWWQLEVESEHNDNITIVNDDN